MLFLMLVLPACGNGNDAAGAVGSSSDANFSIEITGSYAGELTKDNATANFSVTEMGDGIISHQLWFGTGDEMTIFVLLPISPQADTTYTISDQGFLESDTANAMVIIRQDTMTSAGSNGTITFDSVDDALPGGFSFTATDPTNEAFKVMVSGTFSDVPTSETDDE